MRDSRIEVSAHVSHTGAGAHSGAATSAGAGAALAVCVAVRSLSYGTASS